MPSRRAESDLEAPPGIEPGCTDLQSAASPLRHGAFVKAHASSRQQRPAQLGPAVLLRRRAPIAS